jgi:hypothetical protein
MYTGEIGNRIAVVRCIHAQTHNHLEVLNDWKDES